MMRLKSKLLSLNANKTNKVKVFSPRNCEELRIPFKTDKTAKVVGKLASIPQPTKTPKEDSEEPRLITGVLVQNDFKMSLMAPEDLREYAGLTTTTIACKQRLKLSAAGIDLIKWGLEGTFGSIEELPETKHHLKGSSNGDSTSNGDTKMEDADEEFPIDEVVGAYLVMGCVTVRYRASGEVELEWEGNMLNDGIADAVMAVLLGIESSPAAVKRKSGSLKYSFPFWLFVSKLTTLLKIKVLQASTLTHTTRSRPILTLSPSLIVICTPTFPRKNALSA